MTGTSIKHATLKHIIRDILNQAATHVLDLDRWSVQGLGMLRYYLGDVARLHVWDSRLRNQDVSDIHTHSWDLSSMVIAGEIRNTRYTQHELMSMAEGRRLGAHIRGAIYNRQRLHCGMNGGLLGEPRSVFLRPRDTEFYAEGHWYQQEAKEIHQTDPSRGTVTLMERTFDGDDGEADVFWPIGQRWGDAKPRPATEFEVQTICADTLERWFK